MATIWKQSYNTVKQAPFEKDKPSVIIADTLKSKGLSFAEGKVSYHYWKAKPEELEQAEIDLDNIEKLLKAKMERIRTMINELKDPRKTFGEAVIEAALENPNIVVLSADSSSGSGLGDFPAKFPDRHFEFGIMEQGVIGYACGLATTGKIPVFAAIAPFVTARPYEMFRNDLGYMNQNVKVVGRCAGLTYDQLGSTHHSIDDVAIIRTIPGVTIINPGDPVTIRKAVHAMIKHVGPCYMKIGNPKMPVLYPEDVDFRLGKGIVIKDGRDVALDWNRHRLVKSSCCCKTS